MMKVRFEPTLSYGHIIQLIAGLGTIIAMFVNVRMSIERNETAIRQQNLVIEELKSSQMGLVQNQNLLAKNLSVLISVVQERTKSKIDMP